MLLLAGGKSGRAEAAHTSVWVQLLVNARVRVGAVWGRKVCVALQRCVLFSHPCWLQTMSCPYLDCNMTYTLKTAAASSSRATGEGRAALFAHQLGNPASPGKACRDPNWLLDWDSESEREAVICLPLPSSQEIQTSSISQATAHWSGERVSGNGSHIPTGAHAHARAHARRRRRGRGIVPAPLRLRC